MLALRRAGETEARRVWADVDLRDLDATYMVGTLALTVTGFQREAARLSGGYLHAFIESELGERVNVPVVYNDKAGLSRSGDQLGAALQNPIAEVKGRIGDGEPPEQALAYGLSSLVVMVGLAVDTAARDSLQSGMRNAPEVTGWRRAVKGTCGACLAAARARASRTSETMHIHPNCNCVTEPVIGGVVDTYQRRTGKEIFDDMTPEEQDEALGLDVASAVRAGEILIDDLLHATGSGSSAFISQASKDALGLRGTPVRDVVALSQVSRENYPEYEDAVHDTLDMIDQVHRYPKDAHPSVIAWDVSTLPPRVRGQHRKTTREINLNVLDPELDGTLVDPEDEHIIMTLLHELGHKADVEFDAANLYGASQLAYIRARGRGLDMAEIHRIHEQGFEGEGFPAPVAEPHPLLVRLMGEIIRAPSTRSMRQILAANDQAARYFTDPEEMFARAYMQWILTDRGRWVGVPFIDPQTFATHWGADEFEPIQEAFENLFRELGLLKPRRD